MTLVQTLFNSERIIQVADRRLTWPDGSVADDEYTKLVCWNQRFSVAFTGLARIDRRRRKSTSEWIAEVLSDYVIFENGVRALCVDAHDRVKRLPTGDNRLAIVIAGYDDRDVPLVVEIANFDTTGNPNIMFDYFGARFAKLPPGSSTWTHHVGAPVSGLELRLLRRYIPRVLRKDPVNGHNRAIKLLVENQRRVHRQHSTVGEDAQAVNIPRNVQEHGLVMSNLDGLDIPAQQTSFVYFDKRGFQYMQCGPLMAHGGMVIDQFEGTADPENPDNGEIGFRFVKVPRDWGSQGTRAG